MRLQLTPHPDFPSHAVSQVVCEVTQSGDRLMLAYVAVGRIADLAIPKAAAPARTDELWRHTCFEAFLRSEGDGYLEFNFAPSGQWAAYRFSGYRQGMAPAQIEAPRIIAASRADRLELTATLASSGLAPSPCRLALSAVIEDRTGVKSYWALAHPPGRPDFHHEAGFVSQLPAMEAP